MSLPAQKVSVETSCDSSHTKEANPALLTQALEKENKKKNKKQKSGAAFYFSELKDEVVAGEKDFGA